MEGTWKSLSATPLGMSASPVVYRIGKKVPTYRRYAHNSGQDNSDLLTNQLHAKIVIVSGMDLDLFGRHNEVLRLCSWLEVAQAAAVCRHHLRSFPPSNYESLARPVDKVMQND